MDRRRQSRVNSVFRSAIWGIDAKFQPFQAKVSAVNMSGNGISCKVWQPLRHGDTIELQYEGQTTAYTVIWKG